MKKNKLKELDNQTLTQVTGGQTIPYDSQFINCTSLCGGDLPENLQNPKSYSSQPDTDNNSDQMFKTVEEGKFGLERQRATNGVKLP